MAAEQGDVGGVATISPASLTTSSTGHSILLLVPGGTGADAACTSVLSGSLASGATSEPTCRARALLPAQGGLERAGERGRLLLSAAS